MPDNIDQAASLAAWLIQTKNKQRNVALIIACNKYKVPFNFRPVVSKRATAIMNGDNIKMRLL
jgi:hypothetical protein